MKWIISEWHAFRERRSTDYITDLPLPADQNDNGMEKTIQQKEYTLDPANWDELRDLGHRMVDDMFEYLSTVRDRKVWQPFGDEHKIALDQPLPMEETPTSKVYEDFKEHVLPFTLGNIHPRFWGWVVGTGSPTGMLADMLISAMNASPSFGEHATIYVEKQVLDWTKEIYGFPKSSSGLLTTGASMANILALTVARNSFRSNIRKEGIQTLEGKLTMYASVETHSCQQKAAELLGIGSDQLRKIPVDDDYQIRIDLLEEKIKEDKVNGFIPFCIVGNAGTVNTGAIDDLDALAAIAKKEGIWFHIDGAFGAVPNLLPDYKNKLRGLEKADSLTFDFHKWFYVNYEVGGVLIKDPKLHKDAFNINANYLAHHPRGIIAGDINYNHLGIELSRNAKAIKVWMILKEQGIDKYRKLIAQNIQQAQYLAALVNLEVKLQLLAPVPMNIVCFRYTRPGMTDDLLNELNKEILMQLHEQGIAAPSFTILKGRYAIRVAITNHRSRKEDFELLVKEVVRLGDQITKKAVNGHAHWVDANWAVPIDQDR